MAITEDASQPITVQRAAGTGTTVVTASFSPPANTLLMVQCVIGWGSAASGTPTVSCSDSVAGSYTAGPTVKNVSATPTSQGALFYRYLSSAPGSMTVTCTSSSATSKAMLLRVRVLTGVDPATPNGATATLTSSKTTSLTTTVAGSMVYCVGGDGSGSTMTVVSGTTSTGTDLWSDPISGDNMAIGRSTSTTVTPGSTAFGWSAPAGGIFAGLEIRPAAAGQSIAVGQSTETDTANAVTWPRIRAIGQATETDTGNTLVPFRPPPPIGQAASGETASTITPFGPTAALAEAVDDPDRTVIYSVEVDWDRDGTWDHALSDVTFWVTDMTVDRSATGDLPAEASLVEGSIAATLQVTLGGVDPTTGLELAGSDGLSALETFGPYREDSPLWGQALLGCPIRASVGLLTDTGAQLVRQFTGQIRSLSPNSGDRTVVLNALDPTDLLRAPITLPTHGQYYSDVVGSNHKLNINSQAVVDYILRTNGFYASPAAIPTAQISCTGHGWLAAEVGRTGVPRGIAGVIPDANWYIDDGPFDMLACRGVWDSNGMYQEFFAREPFSPTPGNGIGIGMWVRAGTGMGVTAGNRILAEVMPLVDVDALKFRARMYSDGKLGGFLVVAGVESGFAQPISTPSAWMYVGVHFQIKADGNTTIRYRQNANTSSGSVATPTLTSTISACAQATVWTNVDWSNLQIWYDWNPPSGTWPGETHTPTASIDKGANWLTHLPDVVEQESLTVLKDVVGAEYGLVGFDEFGVPTFRARTSSTDPTTVDKTVSADKALIDLGTQINVDSVRNVVSTETTQGFLRFNQVVVESKDVLDWQSPVGISTYDVPLAWGAIATTTQTIPQVASASWNDTYVWGYVAVQAASPTIEIAGGITVTATAISDRLVRLTVRNYSAFPVRFATTSGSPALRVAGYAMVLDPARIQQVRSDGSVEVYSERVFKIDANPWRQLQSSLADVAGGLLGTLSNPMPVVVRIPVVGDPRLQIGDVIRISDPAGQGSFRAYVVGVSPSLRKGGALETELTLRPVAPPGLGILDDTELGILDSTLVLAP